jgi:hypothetical protein
MGAGRSLWVGVAVMLVASPSFARADVMQATEERFNFDCSVAPLALDDAVRQELAAGIGRKWNLGMASAETLRSKITVRVCLAEDGRPCNLILLAADGPTEEAVDRLFQTARRAILRAGLDGGLPLPADSKDTWRVLDLVFDANGMTQR